MGRMLSVSVSTLSQFAHVANSWMLTGSPQAEEALLTALAEDVRAPSFGGVGRKAVCRGLKRLAWRFDRRLRLTPGEQEARPLLQAVVQEDDGRWQRVGHVVIEQERGGPVCYVDYRDEELGSSTPAPSAAPRTMVGLSGERLSDPSDRGVQSVVS